MATVPATSEYGVVVRHAGPLPAGTNTLGSVGVNARGVEIDNRPDGFLRVQIDPTTILYDGFDSLNTTDTWTTGGVTPSVAAGALSHNSGTTASASSSLVSKMSIAPGTSSWLYYAAVVQLESSVTTGSQRAWGLGTISTPTLSAPVQNGPVFEIDASSGNLLASIYSGGTRTQSLVITRPTDNAWHRYSIYYRASRVYFELDGVDVAEFLTITTPVASATLSVLSVVVNSSTAPTVAPLLRFTTAAVGDSARLAHKISDGLYPWRQVTVKAAATAVTTADSAMAVGLHPSSPLPAGSNALGSVSITSAPASVKGTQGSSAVPTQDLKDAGRTRVAIVFMGASPATAETLLTVVKISAGVAATGSTSIGVASGKILRITSISFSMKAGAATAASGTVTIRTNPSGATTISSTAEIRLDLGMTAAVIGAADKVEAIFPDGLEFTGSQTIGMSLVSSATSNVNSITMHGFEY